MQLVVVRYSCHRAVSETSWFSGGGVLHAVLCRKYHRPMMFYMIIIIIRHELGLDRSVSASCVSSEVFQVFVHLVYSSALFLASCCSFLLHVNSSRFDLYLLVSCQLVLL
jgi:hypothetical protein